MKQILMMMAGVMIMTTAQAKMVITENGKAKATIVVAADAPYKNQLAAKELKHFLDRISGADFVIKTDDQKVTGPKILVGRSRYTAKMKLDIPSGQSYEEIKEGFIVKTVGKDLVLAGNDDGWKLGTGFILNDIGVGYDIYCTNWDGLKYDSECHHAHISKLLDSKIVYVKNQSAYQQLCKLREDTKSFLESGLLIAFCKTSKDVNVKLLPFANA